MKRVLQTGFLALALGLLAQGCATNDDAMPGGMGDRPNGSGCAVGSQCASGICNVAVCQAQVNGMGLANSEDCSAHRECASGFCIVGSCQATPNAGGTNRPVGSPCTASEQCSSDLCDTNMCRDPATIDGGTGDDAGGAGDARNDRPDRAEGADTGEIGRAHV